MKKLILLAILAFSALTISAQDKDKLGLVMSYYWDLDNKTYETVTEGKCKDGIEFDFQEGKAQYYTPDKDVTTTLCTIRNASKLIVNDDKSTTKKFKLYFVGEEVEVDCVLNISADYRKINFTMSKGNVVKVYTISNMLGDVM